MAERALPITILTGFLGSGKSTLLNALLAHPDMDQTAVLINEYGPVSIDHLLLRKIDENILLLESGCLCCSVRGDLITALRDLFIRRVKDEIPAFNRLVIETTGLADPAPIVHSLRADPLLDSRYRLDGIVTTVDACLGSDQLRNHPETVRQAAMADRLLVTKTDMATADAVAELEKNLRQINPAAPLIHVVAGQIDPMRILDAGLFGRSDRPDPDRWLNTDAYATQGTDGADFHHQDHHHHDHRISSFCLTLPDPVIWSHFVEVMELLMATQGANLLRVKGVLNIDGAAHPVAVHGIQHIFHPPVSLSHLHPGEHASRLVFITRDLGEMAVRSLFKAVLTQAPAP